MEQLVILIVIALISFINWLIQRSAELRKKRQEERRAQGLPDPSLYRQTDEADGSSDPAAPAPDPAAEMRKLMEALGLPVEPEESREPEIRREPPPLPSASTQDPELKPTRVDNRTAPERPAGHSQDPPPEAIAEILRHSPITNRRQRKTATISTTRGPVLEALRSPGGIRQAIILREVLGPPKALLP